MSEPVPTDLGEVGVVEDAGAVGGRDRVVLDAEDISRALTRMAHQILEANRGAAGLVLAGIPSRGVPLAHRLARAIAVAENPASSRSRSRQAPWT